MMGARTSDLDAVIRHARPGASARQIAEALDRAGVSPSRGGRWHRVRVHRAIETMRRRMGSDPERRPGYQPREHERAGDVAARYRRVCGEGYEVDQAELDDAEPYVARVLDRRRRRR